MGCFPYLYLFIFDSQLAGLGKGDSNFVASPETLKLCSVSSSILKRLKIDTKEASIFKRLKIDTTKYARHLMMH